MEVPGAMSQRAPGEGTGGPPAADSGLAPFFEATADPMIVYGPDFIVLMANPAAGRLLRLQAELMALEFSCLWQRLGR